MQDKTHSHLNALLMEREELEGLSSDLDDLDSDTVVENSNDSVSEDANSFVSDDCSEFSAAK